MKNNKIISLFTMIDRDVFLRYVLTPYVPLLKVEEAIIEGVYKANISDAVLKKIAEQRIKKYSLQAGTGSLVTTAIGGVIMVPLDYVQFFSNCAMLIQELYYLYGYYNNSFKKAEDVEMLFYMMIGASTTVKTTGNVMSVFAKYLLKKTGKKSLMKMVPAVGCLTSSSFSYFSLRSLAHEFISKLKALTLQLSKEERLKIDEFIDVEYREIEGSSELRRDLEKVAELRSYLEAGYLNRKQYNELLVNIRVIQN